MIFVYADKGDYADYRWRALGVVESPEAAQALCAMYATLRVDDWHLAWIAIQSPLTFHAVRTMLQPSYEETTLQGTDITEAEQAAMGAAMAMQAHRAHEHASAYDQQRRGMLCGMAGHRRPCAACRVD